MYKINKPVQIIFIPIVTIGIILCAITPNYFTTTRILSITALLIGEAGLSFIPVLAFYPKASITQAITLATVYFFTTFLICFAAWGINSFGITSDYAFLIKDGEFQINTHALFVSNIFSLLALILSFKLVYQEESKSTKKDKGYSKDRPKFVGFQKPLLKQPEHVKKVESYSSKKDALDEDLIKPFEFEPEIEISTKDLPEESSGKLFSHKEEETQTPSEFFDDGETTSLVKKTLEKPKPIQLTPFQSSDIKKDLAAIFEQYSSLNAVRKLTFDKSKKILDDQKEQERKRRQIEVHVEGEDIHDASFRQISETEKLEEIREELKKELQEELKAKLTQEIPDKSIKTIKEELIESLKEEIKKELVEKTKEVSQEDINTLKGKLATLNNKELKIAGSFILSKEGNLLAEEWREKQVLQESAYKSITQLFRIVSKEINKTNQGSLFHILLESENGTLALAKLKDKILAINTKGTGENNSGQILRAISSIEEN
ncbi:MAG: hypothetical protein HYY52_05405 [Candidatus Melainabacteria bacterium]|nr:hypothetical protein [Candidatus Melainabacteria bacterium]